MCRIYEAKKKNARDKKAHRNAGEYMLQDTQFVGVVPLGQEAQWPLTVTRHTQTRYTQAQ